MTTGVKGDARPIAENAALKREQGTRRWRSADLRLPGASTTAQPSFFRAVHPGKPVRRALVFPRATPAVTVRQPAR